jgi:ornithine cyclodeaminase
MGPRFVDGTGVRDALPMAAAVDALERAFTTTEGTGMVPRSHLTTPDGDLLLMPATGPPGTGVKLVTVSPLNPARGLPLIHALYVLFAAKSMEPVLVVDGEALTALRTAAVSALATRWLALPEPHELVIFGAGIQAAAHLDAMRCVRPSLRRLRVVSRTRARAEALAGRARDLGMNAEVAGPEAVSEADIVCCCTSSDVPVFDGDALLPGTHVNAVGSYRADARELDDRAVVRARLVVESRVATAGEPGDLVIPMGAGLIGPKHVVADLWEIARGARVRTGPDDITVFKSVGMAFEDLVVVGALMERIGT